MADLHDEDKKPPVFYATQDAPVTYAVTPQAGHICRERFAAEPRVLQVFYFRKVFCDAHGLGSVDSGKVFFCLPRELNPPAQGGA